MTVAQLPSGRWRARVYYRGQDRSVTAVLGLEKTSFATREEAVLQRQIARDLLHTRWGNPERQNKPKDPKKYWSLDAKGETDCRNCGASATHLHHIVPRAFYPKAAENIEENGIPLCSRCHRRWHSRVIEIPHGVLTDLEFRFACKTAGTGWVSRHYFDPEMDADARFAELRGRNLRSGRDHG
jgi:hypothetical protein